MSAEENFFTEIVKCEVCLFFGEMIFIYLPTLTPAG